MRENVTFKIVNILLICYINCTRKGIWKPDKTNQPAKKKTKTNTIVKSQKRSEYLRVN